ncbi:MAG: bifunctional diaminohydroxyphosphoribosylaminopyrimidine deaminase/5-amino-6-(5-phosphoribosylamino)uracil reductase RibD [Rubrivivax sp.]|nr:bifunctional diaminohydroxyphosphoribosylaminopyrimidine deaminase/5-amino-6-(5-phosphoribosylamino)uracil reductase RibD [Rubrivivax sp.]
MPIAPLDRQRLHQALLLAEQAIGLSDPNPRVGCVIGRDDGTVLGQGWTQEAGGPHAEVMALREARQQGHDLRGATVWVSLEPCAHHGRTPPCCDALVEAGVGRVVIATTDPYPAVAGQGIARLAAAGIAVDLGDDGLRAAAWELNIGFFSRVVRGRPWVRVKSASSLDGRTALPDGQSQWITGSEARADGHAWRRRAGAVLTGIGTVLADDPRMDVRLVPTQRQPLRCVLDSQLRLPMEARIRHDDRLLVYAEQARASARPDALTGAGTLVGVDAGPGGGLDLAAVLRDLNERQINELHVEAGARLSGAFVDAGLCDELLLYLAPTLLGDGSGIAALTSPRSLAAAYRLQWTECSRVGADLRLRLRAAASAPSAWMPAAA